MPIAQRVFDADGVSLDEYWKGSPDAYLGTTAYDVTLTTGVGRPVPAGR
ncbi:hypothetical protein ACFU6S_28230 [Streptomyces sp. NPDC057456]